MIFEIVFWISVLAIFHTYLLYPVILKLLTINRKPNNIVFTTNDDLPFISILLSAYNEELVIEEKIKSMFDTTYPINKIEVLIGSDASSDKTNEIIERLAPHYPQLTFIAYPERKGKSVVINELIQKTNGEILILTDANVIFDRNTLFEVVKHFKNTSIGLVDTHMVNKGINKEGISIQESAYISREVTMKNREGLRWGTMMGPFGGCFAIRRELYCPVPKNYLVEDFYINMMVFVNHKKAINCLTAIVYEDVSSNLTDEFRRKIRIATGDFQNLKVFRHFLLNFITHKIPLQGLSFSFLSHKVIRWLGPFLIIASLLSVIVLSFHSLFYRILFYIYIFTFFLPILDFLLRKIRIHIVVLRFVTHFYTMNLALLIGFYKFLKGVKTNVWRPTKRNL